MLASTVTVLYRLACLAGYGYVAFWTVENLRNKATTSLTESLVIQSRFLTFDTLLVQIMYYFLALLLMPTKCVKTKSMLACVAATTATVVSVMFWAIYFRDVNLLADTEAMRTYPAWHMHVTHTLVALTAVLDIALSRPTSLPYFGTGMVLLAYYGSYAVYTEWLINTQKVYVYPVLKVLSTNGRYQFYGIVFATACIVFLACAFLIKLLSGQRRKSKKEKARNRKPEPSASPKPKTSPQPTTGKKAKQKKQD